MKTPEFRQVYVWELAVRVFHWANALCLMVLIATGYMIAYPPALLSDMEASQQFWFGYIRMAHFISGYLLVALMIFRVYWAFKANKYGTWKVFFPFNKKERVKMWETIKYDIFFMKHKPGSSPHVHSVGHNNVAAFSYLMMFLLAVVMIVTGFAMMEPTSSWFFPKLFGWVTPLLGGDFNVRLVHHFAMWPFILFIVVHVYLVLFHDWLEGTGESSSMVSGYKFVEKDRLVDQKEVSAHAEAVEDEKAISHES